ncbi:MAG: hypothetical protein GY809_19045 [Planctomycetes bacterium]|nr:hypothetical protein [Planctomycetota bacterium]
MKPLNELIDKNTSRLVKLTRDSKRPSEAFQQTLIHSALKELQPQTEVSQKKGIFPMKKTSLLMTIAASVLVLIGITLYMNSTPDRETEPTQVASGQSNLLPLPISLPEPQFAGTPANLSGVDNLEPPLGRARAAFLAPPDVANVALNRPVAALMDPPIMGDLSQIVDGDKEATEDGLVDMGPMRQWVQIDLGSPQELWAILFWHFHKQERVYLDVVVQVADDPDFITNVRTLFNNDTDNSSGLGVGTDKHYVDTNEGKLVDAKQQVAQYVRLYSNQNNLNDRSHYLEIEVYGRPMTD